MYIHIQRAMAQCTGKVGMHMYKHFRAILRNHYDGKEVTDNNIYTYKTCHTSSFLKLVRREKFLYTYTFVWLGGKGNYNCLSVACRNSCGFQRMLESPSIPTSKPS